MDIDYRLKADSNRRNEPYAINKGSEFGTVKTDHMFLMNFDPGKGWHSARIVPDEPIPMSLHSVALHYGIQCFEGAKVFQHEGGELYGFRWDQNATRLNHSASMIGMPAISIEDQLQAMKALADVERQWYPEGQDTALYVRPMMIGVTESFRVTQGDEFLYAVMLSPVGSYFPGGLKPIDLLITDEFKRVAPSGLGTAKVGGNYAGSLRATARAREVAAKQVLYIDATNLHLEEAGAMNHFHVDREEGIVIPEFTDTILESITSRSVLELSKRLSVDVSQRRIRVIDFLFGVSSGRITEAGGLGTAAVVAPVGGYRSIKNDRIKVGDGNVGEVTQEVYDLLTGIQRGRIEAPNGWLHHVPRLEE